MRLTIYSDYALRLMIYLATHRERLSSARDVARGYGISKHHLTKVANELAAAGLVEAVRGKHGGLRLARAPHLVSIGDVVRLTERDFNLVGCFDAAGPGCPIEKACLLQRALQEALDAFFRVLDRYTIADLMARRALLRDLLPLPPGGRTIELVAR